MLTLSLISAELKKMEMMNKVKERTCLSCGEKESKEKLLKWVNLNGVVVPDWAQKNEGRSVYTHLRKECIYGIYDLKKLPAKFFENTPGFAIDKKNIMNFVKEQSFRSLNYFISLCIKSGVLFKGQNLIMDQSKQGKTFKYLICAADISERTISEVEKTLNKESFRTDLSKLELGAMIDGRPSAVIALTNSEQSEKAYFYMSLLKNFISGDTDAY